MPNAQTHPSAQELTAFGQGKLPDGIAGIVAEHLEVCAACRKTVESSPPDSFVGKLRRGSPGASALPTYLPGAPGTRSSQSSAPFPADSPPDLPPELASHPKYRIVRELGRGGMGVVYQAVQILMERHVALKVINPAVLNHPEALPRFRAEVRAAARLDHPNIVRAYDAEQVGDLHLLVMEYVEGTNLADGVRRRGVLPVKAACYYLRQAALGLQHAFEQGMVHRDIKPGNLMVADGGIVKILDFGLARLRTEGKSGGLTQMDAFMGTPEYVSPEQATDARTADIRSDIYSLGCTFYYMLTGRAPFQEETALKQVLAQIEQEPPSLENLRSDVPPELSAVAARMLAKDPAERYQTPIELARALVPFIKSGEKGPAAARPTPAPATHPPARETAFGRDTSRMPPIRKKPAQTILPERPAAVTAPALETKSLDPRGSGASRREVGAAAEFADSQGGDGRRFRWIWLLAACVPAVLLVFAAVVYIGTDYGTIKIDVNDASVTVHVDGNEVTVEQLGEPITLRAGPHGLTVKRGDMVVETKEFRIRRGTNDPLVVNLSTPERLVDARSSSLPKKRGTLPSSNAHSNNSPDADGFIPIFNGSDLTGWFVEKQQDSRWHIEGDAVVGRSDGWQTRSYLLSRQRYRSFVLRFEFMLDPGTSAGVAIRAQDGDMLPCENGGLIYDHPILKLTDPVEYPNEPSGTTHWVKNDYPFTPPAQRRRLPTGRWYPAEIAVRGETCVASLAVNEVANISLERNKSGKIIPALWRTSGSVGFQINTGTLRLRCIQLKELPPGDSTATSPTQPPEETTFLSELNLVDKTHENNWFSTDGTVFGTKFLVEGKESPHGIFCHPPRGAISQVSYQLEKRWSTFRCGAVVPRLGDDAEQRGLGSPLTFEVLGDGKVLWSSEPVSDFGKPQWCGVKVQDVDILQLRVVCPGSSWCARAVWLEPRVSRPGPAHKP